MRQVVLALLLAPQVSAQLHNEDCSYTDDGVHFLCVPRFCPAPKLMDNLFRGPYRMDAPLATGAMRSMDKTLKFGGYHLDVICPNVTSLALFPPPAPGAQPPGAPPIPVYKRGCQAISPLPTLAQSVDLDLTVVWIILCVYLFYALAFVCEEFLVPAINMVVEKTGIPDDVAGATLLAAGCNSPEFFSSIIGIFVADSTVGVGTVIGSAPFNVCCITGGACLAVGGALVLDPWLMARELISLMIVLVMCLIFLDDYLVETWEALVLVLFYCFIYVPLLANFESVKRFLLRSSLRCCCPGAMGPTFKVDAPQREFELAESGSAPLARSQRSAAAGPTPGTFQSLRASGSVRAIDDITGAAVDYGSSMRVLSAKPGTLETTPSPYTSTPVEPAPSVGVFGALANSLMQSLATEQKVTFIVPKRDLHTDAAGGVEGGSAQATAGAASEGGGGFMPRLLNDHKLEGAENSHELDIERWRRLTAECQRRAEASSAGGFNAVMLKRPRGFTKVNLRRVAYQARFFIIDAHPTHPIRYSHVDQDIKQKFATVPVQEVVSITRHSEVEVVLTLASSKTYKLRAPYNDDHAGETMQRFFDHLVIAVDRLRTFAPPPKLPGEQHEEAHEHPPWYQWPSTENGGTATDQVLYVLTFIVKAPVFLTTPNVLVKGNEKFYPLTIIMSMFWLAIFAILMTDVVEYIGCGIGIDTTVMGLSLGAIGTSFPNLYASILIAKQGAGDGAVCQAIAANTFNACICLGLLWLLHNVGLGMCDFGSHALPIHHHCGGCYAPTGLQPLCPFWEGTNNHFGRSAGSTKGAILVTFLWAVVFTICMVVFGGRLNKLSAWIMLGIYLVYIGYQFVAAFVPGFAVCIEAWNICI